MQSRFLTVLFCLIIPFVLVVGCFGFYNRVEPRIFGFPFIYAWIFGCFLAVSGSMYIGWLLDPASDRNLRKSAARRRQEEVR